MPVLHRQTVEVDHKVKKEIYLTLEFETDDDINITDNFIKQDLKQEISCCSNYYDIKGFKTTYLGPGRRFFCNKCDHEFITKDYKYKFSYDYGYEEEEYKTKCPKCGAKVVDEIDRCYWR